MINVIVRRIYLALVTLLFVSFVTFVILRATGNPVDVYLDVNRTPEQVAALTEKLHLDQPIVVQYLIYLKGLLIGDFGDSLQFGGPAIDTVASSIGPTLQLLVTSLMLSILVGLIGGLVSAVWRNRWPDALISAICSAGQSMPPFWLGILLIQLFALKLRWLPTSGIGTFQHLILPALTLSALLIPNFLLVTRTAIIEVASEQFINTARAKGMPRLRILLTHILPNALGPMISFIGIQIGALMGGAILTETIFGWPGIGRLMVAAVSSRDAPIVIATVTLVSVIIIIVNIIVDALQAVVDPRIEG